MSDPKIATNYMIIYALTNKMSDFKKTPIRHFPKFPSLRGACAAGGVENK